MGTQNWFERVAELHKEWIRIADAYGAGEMAEDLVQDSYLKIERYNVGSKMVKKNGKVNKGFMFFIVKNTVLNYHKQKRDFEYEYPENLPDVEVCESEEAWNYLCTKVDEITYKWKWSDRQIFDDYRFTEDSIRGIGKKYNISFVSIFGTIKECKQHIRYELKEDWQDWQNGDYDKI